MATGLPVRTENIIMTDMKQSGLLIAPHCMLGTKQARRRVKPGPRGPPGENKLSLMEKSGEFQPLPTPHFYDHIISSPPWAAAVMGDQLFFFCRFSGRNGAEMYIHFMVISQREKCTLAAGALAPVPTGLKTIAWPSWYHLKPCKHSLLLA